MFKWVQLPPGYQPPEVHHGDKAHIGEPPPPTIGHVSPERLQAKKLEEQARMDAAFQHPGWGLAITVATCVPVAYATFKMAAQVGWYVLTPPILPAGLAAATYRWRRAH